MSALASPFKPRGLRQWAMASLIAATTLIATSAHALPLFNRQTGQNCVACHAGGQFPELTPYGRLFKLTGYTIGQRTALPLSAMVVESMSSVANTFKSDNPSVDFARNDMAILATGSLFAGGKITNNLGAFVQVTRDPFATVNSTGGYQGKTKMDNADIRYADRVVDGTNDFIWGVSLNNNPSVSDPWNTAAAWMQYVPVPSPTSSSFIDGTAPYPSFGAGANIAGLTAYGFLNQSWYGEAGLYKSATGALHVMAAGLGAADLTRLKGAAPYWRLAWNKQWDAYSLMLGAAGMHSKVYVNPLDMSDPNNTDRWHDLTLDAQLQYLLDPHAFTAQLAIHRQRHGYPPSAANQPSPFVDASGQPLANSNSSDTITQIRAKLSYVYQARYGTSLSLFTQNGTTNTANQTSGFDPTSMTITSDPNAGAPSTRVGGNLSGNPGVTGQTLEVFMMPIQYIRIGAQYTNYSRYNGASHNYDGFGRNASDNNSIFVYLWGAY
ncbi:MAG: cytochrome C [Burkholderiales bacterium]|nr:cytochrome C [Burkholderiales bacterium]